MFARSLEEVRRELNEQTRVLLVSRCRAGLWALLCSDVVFALGDLRLSSAQVTPLLLLKAVQAACIAFGFWSLRRAPDLDRVTMTALLVAGSNCILSAAVGIVRQDVATLPLVHIVLAMATAMLLPWGARPQLALVATGAVSGVWAVTEVGGAAAAVAYPVIAMMVAFVVSVWVAFEFDRYRMAIEHRNLELRGYRDVVEDANDAILTLDTAYRITGANRGAEVIFGYRSEELLGQPIELLFQSEDARVLRRRWAETLCGASRENILSFEAKRREGGTVPIEVKARRLAGDEAGGRIQAILRDVTEKRVVERMRNDFMAMLSHDMKTPLASILGFAEMLRDRIGNVADLRRIVDRIEANAQIAHSLAVNFVDVAKIEDGSLELQLESTSLNEIVDHVLRHQESMARAREISLDTELARDLPALRLDRRHIDRVVANLVSNAIKFSPTHGRVHVGTACVDGRVMLLVRDHGPGIPAEERGQVFERYRQLRGLAAEGSGLGLYIVKRIVEAHGGSVSVLCPADGGSEFRISFEHRPLAA